MFIALVTDLIFSTKITGTARALGTSVSIARSFDRLRELLEGQPAGTVTLIIDLDVAGLDPVAAIAVAKSHPAAPQIIAYLSHVQVDLAAAARQAGADRVLARSAFVVQLPGILTGAEGPKNPQ